MKTWIPILILFLIAGPTVFGQDGVAQATAELDLAKANQSYIAAEIEQAERALKEGEEQLARQRQLLARGLVARQTVEQSESVVLQRQQLLELLIEQKRIADRSVDLAKESLDLALTQQRGRVSSTITRVTKNYGRGTWSSKDFSDLGRTFREVFGQPLPITALGQTRTHNRLGFNHRKRMDIGVHPDDPQGQWIMKYLEERGVPYIAFREGVPGHSTGPHIHVGLPSHRR